MLLLAGDVPLVLLFREVTAGGTATIVGNQVLHRVR